MADPKNIVDNLDLYNMPLDGPVRPKILKLARKISDRMMGLTVKAGDPEYYGLTRLTDDMADVCLKMKIRHPYTIEELQKMNKNFAPEYVQEMMDELSILGIVEYNWENPTRTKQYKLNIFVEGSGEYAVLNQEKLDARPENARFFERMTILPLPAIAASIPPGGGGLGMHVIPVEKAIPTGQKSLPIEHISHWLKKYDKYAAIPCACRMARLKLGDGCGDDPKDWCIAVGDMADYMVETDKGGRYIDYDEVMAILQQAEDNGFVHQITNIDGEDKIFVICNCNINNCFSLRDTMTFNIPNFSRSAYVAHVDPAKCVACGRCVEYCPAGAVKLGQKLCTRDGYVQYPKAELPDDQPWGEEHYDFNYRNNIRKNCYDTGTAPCKTACPAHIAVQGYLKMAAQGRYRDALALIKRMNPLPAVCGAICNRRCEDACTRGSIDKPLAIDEVKKFIAAQELHAEQRYIPPVVKAKIVGDFEEKVAIIGAGPAGMSCAYYLAEMSYKPVVFEKESRPGGMLMNGIPSFRLEKDVLEAEIDVLREMGVEFRCGVEVGKDITLDELRAQGFKAFYVAIGCQGGRKVNVPGEDAEGVVSAVEFLRKVNLDHSVKLSGKTVVVGGGNVAVDTARTAVRCGASETAMYCLESRDIMPASPDEVTEAEAEDVKVNCGWGPKEILTEDGKVTGVVFKRCTAVFDAEHRFNPTYDENNTITVPCENVVLSIGQSIQWGELLKGSKVKLGRGNGALADALSYQTDEPDIFVGGDVYTGPKFAIDAIAAGHEGAISIHRFVRPGSTLDQGRNRRDFIELDKKNILLDPECFDKPGRQVPGVDAAKKKSFSDDRLVFTEEQVKAETSRCLGCGASVVDENKCIGCAVCTTKCEFDAISISREHPECSTMVTNEDRMKAILAYGAKRQVRILSNKLKNRKSGHA